MGLQNTVAQKKLEMIAKTAFQVIMGEILPQHLSDLKKRQFREDARSIYSSCPGNILSNLVCWGVFKKANNQFVSFGSP